MSAGGDKLKVSWDDIRSTETDEAVKRQESLQRAQASYGAASAYQSPGLSQSVGGSSSLAALLYSPWVYMTAFGMVGGFVGWFLGEIVMGVLEAMLMSASSEGAMFAIGYAQTIFFLNVTGISIAFFLSIADSLVGRNLRGALVNGCVGIFMAGVGATFVGLFIDILFNILLAIANGNILGVILARTVAWGIVGAFLAAAPGVTMRSIKRFGIGVVGGLIGGVAGGVSFDPIGMITGFDLISRFVGIMAIGTLAGAATGLIEAAAKSGWLRVTEGLIAGKQFILYKKSTAIGSSPECDIYLFKDPTIGPKHALIHAVSGGYDLEDLGSPTGTRVNDQPVRRTRLKNGDVVRVGRTALTYQEKAKS